jgi:hypothetical protein
MTPRQSKQSEIVTGMARQPLEEVLVRTSEVGLKRPDAQPRPVAGPALSA